MWVCLYFTEKIEINYGEFSEASANTVYGRARATANIVQIALQTFTADASGTGSNISVESPADSTVRYPPMTCFDICDFGINIFSIFLIIINWVKPALTSEFSFVIKIILDAQRDIEYGARVSPVSAERCNIFTPHSNGALRIFWYCRRQDYSSLRHS